MKKQLKSLRLQLLLPVLVMTLFIVIMLSAIFSRAYTKTILEQEQAVNAVGFETISSTVPASITAAIGSVFSDESGRSVSAFSMLLPSPQWTLVREISMEGSEQVIRWARGMVGLLAVVIFLIALTAYQLWLKKFTRL